MIIDEIAIRSYFLPFSHQIQTARTTQTCRRGWHLVIKTKCGLTGHGDAAPWPGFGSGFHTTYKVLKKLCLWGNQCHPKLPSLDKLLQVVEPLLQPSPEATFAWQTAVLALLSQQQEKSITALLGCQPPKPIPISMLVSDKQAAQKAVDAGYRSLKVKVARQTVEQDIKRIQSIRQQVGEHITLLLDANAGWSRQQAATALTALEPCRISYVEQPLAIHDLHGLAQLRQLQSIPIAIDEGIACTEDLHRHIKAKAIDTVVLKPMFLGIGQTQKIATLAQKNGLSVSLTTALESTIGRLATAHLWSSFTGQLAFGLGPPLDEPSTLLNKLHKGKLYLSARPGLHEPPAQSLTIPNPLASSARSRPEHTALIYHNEHLTFRQLKTSVAQLAHTISQQLPCGSIVVLYGPPSIEWLQYWHALAWARNMIIPIAPKSTSSEFTSYMEEVQPDAAILIQAPHHIREICIKKQVTIIQTSNPSSDEMAEQNWELDAFQLLMLSSGTTGKPRIIPLRTSQLLFAAMGSALRLEHHHMDRWLCCLPLHHIGGLSILLRCTWNATTVVLQNSFTPQAIYQAIQDLQVTQLSLVPTMLTRLLQHEKAANTLTQLRCLLLGGSAASEQLIQQCEQQGIPILLTWGMTESAAQAATTYIHSKKMVGCVGPPMPFVRVENHISGLIIDSPQAGPKPIQTRDQGDIDEHGQIWLHGRSERIINTGGKLVDPQEIEQRLTEHPLVDEAFVAAEPHPEWGESIVAIIVPRTGIESVSHHQLSAFCAETLSRFKLPKRYIQRKELPKTELGKIHIHKAKTIIKSQL